jgi:hypothetical protein
LERGPHAVARSRGSHIVVELGIAASTFSMNLPLGESSIGSVTDRSSTTFERSNALIV